LIIAITGFGIFSTPRIIRVPRSEKIASLHRRERRHPGDVGTGNEGLRAAAGQHHHADACIGRGIREGCMQRIQRCCVQCIQFVRAVDRDQPDCAAVGDRAGGIRSC
jgi:hypothetical protein